jgi:hypothetical protein
LFENSTTIRPKKESMPAIVGVAVIWSALVAAFFHANGVMWPAWVNAALMASLVFAAWRTKVAMKIYEQAGTVFYDSGFGQPREIAQVGDGSRIARVDTGAAIVDFWLGPDGRSRLTTSEPGWGPEALRAFWNQIGLTVSAEPEAVMNFAQARKSYPVAKPSFMLGLTRANPAAQDPALRTVRPSPDASTVAAMRIAAVLVPVYVLGSRHEPPLTIAAVLGGVLLCLGAEASFRARVALLDDGKTVSYRDALGRVKPVATRGAGGRVVRAKFAVGRHVIPRQLWIDGAGRCQMRFNERDWNTDDLAALRTRLGLGYEELPDLRTAASIDEQFPGAADTEERHPLAAAAVLAAAIIGGPILLLLAYAALTR